MVLKQARHLGIGVAVTDHNEIRGWSRPVIKPLVIFAWSYILCAESSLQVSYEESILRMTQYLSHLMK